MCPSLSMIYQLRHEVFRKGSMLNTILLAAMKDVDNTCIQTLASNSGVHLLLAALCRANGVDLNTVNH